MIRRPPRSTPFPTRRSSDLVVEVREVVRVEDDPLGVAFAIAHAQVVGEGHRRDRKSTRLNSSHQIISYAVFCLKKKKNSTSSTPTKNTCVQQITRCVDHQLP